MHESYIVNGLAHDPCRPPQLCIKYVEDSLATHLTIGPLFPLCARFQNVNITVFSGTTIVL